MKRRDVLQGAVGLVVAGMAGRVSAQVPCPPGLDGGSPAPCPVVTGSLGWSWDIPTLQDETDFYENVMGWSIPSNADSFSNLGAGGYPWSSSNAWGFGNIHGDTEGDNLWTWYQQLKRYGNVNVGNGSTTQDWFDDMLSAFKSDLVSQLIQDDAGFDYDHLYASGLCHVYADTGDSEIPPILDSLRDLIASTGDYQDVANRNPVWIASYGGRKVGRQAIAAAYAYEATGSAAWQQMRDDWLWAFENAGDWEEGGVIENGGGAYFVGRWQTDRYASAAEYDAGLRIHSTFQHGVLAEAMWRMYLQTQSPILRDRLIKMARYVEHYAHDPAWAGPNVGSRFGHNPNGSRWHSDGRDSGNPARASTDCSYDMSLVNLLVIGYKLTGDSALLDRAKVHFSRGHRWDPGVPSNLWADSVNHVHKYLDTQCDPSRQEFQFNKGTLQYTYMLLENGGNPAVIT